MGAATHCKSSYCQLGSHRHCGVGNIMVLVSKTTWSNRDLTLWVETPEGKYHPVNVGGHRHSEHSNSVGGRSTT